MSSSGKVGMYSHSKVSKLNIYKSDVIRRCVTRRPPWKYVRQNIVAVQRATYKEIHFGADDGGRGALLE